MSKDTISLESHSVLIGMKYLGSIPLSFVVFLIKFLEHAMQRLINAKSETKLHFVAAGSDDAVLRLFERLVFLHDDKVFFKRTVFKIIKIFSCFFFNKDFGPKAHELVMKLLRMLRLLFRGCSKACENFDHIYGYRRLATLLMQFQQPQHTFVKEVFEMVPLNLMCKKFFGKVSQSQTR